MRPEHERVDLVGDVPGPRRDEADDQPGHEHGEGDDPAAARSPDAARQRRRGAGWSAAAAGLAHARRHERCRLDRGPRGRVALLRRTGIGRHDPTSAHHAAAIAPMSASGRPAARLSSRTVVVVRRADTLSTTPTSPSPHRATSSDADERRDVLGRLQPAVVGQFDEVHRRDRRVGGEHQGDVDGAMLQGLACEHIPGVERHELSEAQAVDVRQAERGSAAGWGTRPARRRPGRRPPRRGR